MSEVKRWEPRDTIVGFDMEPRKDGSFVLYCDYSAAQSELSALRAKCELSDIRISQLTVAIDQSSKAQLENYHMATRAWTESKELQATIERLNGELQAATDLITAKRSVNRTLRNEIERLKAGQGEPVSKQEAATLIASHLAPGRSEGHVAEVARAIIALASTTDNLF